MSDQTTTPEVVQEPTKAESSAHAKALFDLLGYSQDEAPVAAVVEKPAAVVEQPAAAPEPKVKKKVTVKQPEPAAPQPSVEEVVQRTLAAVQPQQQPQYTQQVASEPAAVLSDFTEEEREEFEIAQYAEARDPKRAGLAKQVVDFAKARRELADWNAANLTAPIKITLTQVLARVKALKTSRADRTVKSAPKEMRAQVRETLQ